MSCFDFNASLLSESCGRSEARGACLVRDRRNGVSVCPIGCARHGAATQVVAETVLSLDPASCARTRLQEGETADGTWSV